MKNEYAAAYYAYIWTEMLDHDAYKGFEENGGLTRKNGQCFCELVVSRDNTLKLASIYRNWRGHDPVIQPMLDSRGLIGK